MEKRFQWSKFVNGDRNEQYVIREDNWDLFIQGRDKVLQLLGENVPTGKPVEAPKEEKKPMTVEEFEKKCPDCGAIKVRNPKNGNWFCPDKCWLKGQANFQNK